MSSCSWRRAAQSNPLLKAANLSGTEYILGVSFKIPFKRLFWNNKKATPHPYHTTMNHPPPVAQTSHNTGCYGNEKTMLLFPLHGSNKIGSSTPILLHFEIFRVSLLPIRLALPPHSTPPPCAPLCHGFIPFSKAHKYRAIGLSVSPVLFPFNARNWTREKNERRDEKITDTHHLHP